MTIDEYLTEAQTYCKSGDFAKAQEICEYVLTISETEPSVYDLLGIIAVHLRQYDNAIVYFKKAIELQPNEAIYHHHLANVLARLDMAKEAIKHYHLALKIHPDYADVYNNLGNFYYQKNDLKKAIHYYRIAIKKRRDFTEAYLNLASVFLKKMRYRSANILLHRALSYSDDERMSTQIHSRLSVLAHEFKDFPHAIYHLKELLNLDPNNDEARSLLALNYLLDQQNDQAIHQYSVYLEKVSHDINAHYNLGTLLMSQQDINAATYHFQQVIKLDPDHANAHTNLGTLFLSRGHFDAAIEHFEHVVRLQPDNPAANYILSALNQKEGCEKAPSEYIQQLFDSYAPYYEQHLLGTLHYQTPMLFHETFKKFLLKKHDLIIFDLGCGTGLTAEYFRDYAKTLIGIDLSEKMLSRAKEKDFYDELILGDLIDILPKYKERVDLIIAADVFIYLGDLSKSFELCKQTLKPNGYLLLSLEVGPDDVDYSLQRTARFCHGRPYIEKMATNAQFSILSIEKALLRKQNQEDVVGYIVLLQA